MTVVLRHFVGSSLTNSSWLPSLAPLEAGLLDSVQPLAPASLAAQLSLRDSLQEGSTCALE